MTSRLDDRGLIEALVARDRNAWRQFVETFQGVVLARVARTAQECSRTLNRADMEDLCAEVFASLIANDFSSLRRFEGRSTLATWLSVVTRRICLRHIYKRRLDMAKGSATESSSEADMEEIGEQGNPDALASLIASEDAERLRDCLEQLNPADQHVLRLYYLDELSYAEISQSLDVSINTVGPKLHRAQSTLR